MLPLARLPYVPPQPPPLFCPRRAPREEVMSRLRFSTHTPPALVGACLSKPSPVCPRGRVPREELIVPPGQGLSRPPKWWSPEALPRRGPISSLGSDMCRDPLSCLLGSGLGRDPRHVREGCLRGVPLRYGLHRPSPGGRTLCISVRHLVASRPTVCWDPPDGDAVVIGDDAAADLDGRHCETLFWAQAVVSYTGGG